MAGGALSGADGAGKDYPGKMTAYVVITCFIGATGGLIFGYDLGVSGGVTSMDSFLKEFFPSVYHKAKVAVDTNQYCKFDSELLTLFTSSLYIAALLASLVASKITRKFGRKVSMLAGGVIFVGGSALNAAATNIAMLIIGRLLLGFGIGFANQSVPVYLAEVAPARYRGLFNMWFQLMITIGIFVANLLNYYVAKIEGGWGWRISLGGAAVPGLIMALGSLVLPDSPNSLIDRGDEDMALATLRKIRGTDDVEEEFRDLQAAAKAAKEVKDPWKNITRRKYRPSFVMVLAIPFFQQLTGINVITFYAPVLYRTIGFGDEASLYSAVISGAVNSASTLVSILTVDKVGRRTLFLEGGTQMLISQIIIGAMIGHKFGITGNNAALSKLYADTILAFICIYVAGFAWSWGPLGWLVPSEILPLEIRSAGQSVNVVVNMFFTFCIAQVFLAMLCHMKFFLFFFFAVFVFIMTIFIYFFLPETKGVPIEEMILVWKRHKFWGKYISDEDVPQGLGKHLEP